MLPVVNNSNTLPRQQRHVLARFSVSALVASLPLLYVSLLRPPPAALAGSSAFWFLMSNCVVAAIVAADDAGTLFFGSSKAGNRSSHDEDLPYVSGGSGQPAVAFEEASTMTSGDSIVVDDGALPFVIHGEGEKVSIEPSTDKKNNFLLTGQGGGGGGEIARPSSASDDAIPSATEHDIIKADSDSALPEQLLEADIVEEVEEEDDEIPEAWARAQRSRTPDLQQGKGARKGKLRRSVTEGSKSTQERDYSELSDEELNRRVEEFIARFNREMRRQIEQETGA